MHRLRHTPMRCLPQDRERVSPSQTSAQQPLQAVTPAPAPPSATKASRPLLQHPLRVLTGPLAARSWWEGHQRPFLSWLCQALSRTPGSPLRRHLPRCNLRTPGRDPCRGPPGELNGRKSTTTSTPALHRRCRDPCHLGHGPGESQQPDGGVDSSASVGRSNALHASVDRSSFLSRFLRDRESEREGLWVIYDESPRSYCISAVFAEHRSY